MLSGSEEIWYTAVEAYEVSAYADGIISGGTGGDATVTNGVRFLWVYDPNSPSSSPSGFTGQGWFENLPGSPIHYSIDACGMTLQGILDGFADGSRVNLNDVFQNWQTYVNSQAGEDIDVAKQFQQALGWSDCWSNIAES